MRNKTVSPIRSVQKALRILGVFERHGTELGLTVTELSEELGFPKSVTYKLLSTLTAEGFLSRNPLSRRYSIGPAIITLAGSFLNANPLTHEGGDILRRLSRKTGQTASLGILDGSSVLYVATVEGHQAVKTTAKVGERRPLHATATGKVLFSGLSDVEVEAVLASAPLPRFTERTVTDSRALRKELEQTRREGIAFNRREYNDSVAAVAAAVYDHRGRVVAALSIGVPATALQSQPLEALAPMVAQHAAELSERLGAAPSTIPHHRSIVAPRGRSRPAARRTKDATSRAGR